MTLLLLRRQLIHTQTVKLHIFIICVFQNFFKFHDLRNAALSCNNSPNCVLNRRSFVLQIFDFLDDDGWILAWFEPINTVQKDRSVVVRDQIGLPSCQQLVLKIVYNVTRYRIFFSSAVFLHVCLEIGRKLLGNFVCTLSPAVHVLAYWWGTILSRWLWSSSSSSSFRSLLG